MYEHLATAIVGIVHLKYLLPLLAGTFAQSILAGSAANAEPSSRVAMPSATGTNFNNLMLIPFD